MSQLQAEVQLKFGIANFQRTFALEIDELDSHMSRPLVFEDNVQAYSRQYNYYNYTDLKNAYYDANGVVVEQERTDFTEFNGIEVLKVKSAGKQRVRLFHNLTNTPTLSVTDPVGETGFYDFGQMPTGAGALENPAQFEFNVSYDGRQPFIGSQAPVATPVGVKYIGIGTKHVLDTITFNGSRAMSLKYNYIGGPVRFAYATSFINKSGQPIPLPYFDPTYGLMIATEDCYGAVVMAYDAPYRSYEVTYGVPHGQVWPRMQIQWLRGDITTFPIPPVMVFARSNPPPDKFGVPLEPPQIATTTFARQFFPKGASFSPPVHEEIPDTRKEVKQRIYNPSDSTQYIEVAVATEMHFGPAPLSKDDPSGNFVRNNSTGETTYLQGPPLKSDGTSADEDPKQRMRFRFNPPT